MRLAPDTVTVELPTVAVIVAPAHVVEKALSITNGDGSEKVKPIPVAF